MKSFLKSSKDRMGLAAFLLALSLPWTVMAAPVTLPSGEIIELSTDQLERLKTQPGIFHVPHRKETIIGNRLTERVVVDLPDDLGGGFIIALPGNLSAGLNQVMRQEQPISAMDQSAPPWHEDQKPSSLNTAFTLSAGYRTDDLDWNIGLLTEDFYINILSELTWRDLEIFQLNLANRTLVRDRFMIKAYAAYGWIDSGSNRDSDYACSDRRCEFSRSDNSADGDTVWDLSIGLGPRFTFGLDFLDFTPLVGYSRHEQHLAITNGFQTIPPTGSFEGLDSTYETEWHGPWLGLDVKIRAKQPLGLFYDAAFLFSFEYHWGDYYAQADWNLRDEFAHPKSYEHEADGQGYVVTLAAEFYHKSQLALTIQYTYTRWQTDAGIDRVFLAGGGESETRLNEVNWGSQTLSVGLCYRL